MRSPVLELSTSMRSTWLWAADVDEACALARLLEGEGCSVRPVTGRNAEERVLDLDIGVVAGESLDALVRAGYSFRWSPQQHPLDCGEGLYGVRVARPKL
jgi:hypothetical protein